MSNFGDFYDFTPDTIPVVLPESSPSGPRIKGKLQLIKRGPDGLLTELAEVTHVPKDPDADLPPSLDPRLQQLVERAISLGIDPATYDGTTIVRSDN